ncbi:hypothetical protein HL653_13950 [Sphingomonas sp. AP4-R1]|uniref:hypothetical protein n=1 Tax=Sphingomonas sp. AP4-R1 TaxID=2735134 RepID=UPI00149337F2|nr:hypothetical protein [Sphingomonas sp. AP4-R1]QJU58724.1 hypothetical protein HL653_13950 [Sphingomonas sp. AP4-R1]
MEQPDNPESHVSGPATGLMVRAETIRLARSGITGVLPLASMLIAAMSAFAYVSGIYSYKYFQDSFGIPLSAIQPNLYLILLRGTQSGALGFFVLAAIFLAGSIGVCFLVGVAGLRVLNGRSRLAAELMANPDLIHAGSAKEQRRRRQLLDLARTGRLPAPEQIVRQVSYACISSVSLFFVLLFIPISLLVASSSGYASFFSERTIFSLLFPRLPANFEYVTPQGIFCGNIVMEGEKGIALATPSSIAFLHPDEIRSIIPIVNPQDPSSDPVSSFPPECFGDKARR